MNLMKIMNSLRAAGIGDSVDRVNLCALPASTLLVFGVLWASKLANIALQESKCVGESIYHFNAQLEADAIRHCESAQRYYVAPTEALSGDLRWRAARVVKNPEWILWFWAPIIFVMSVWTRFMWTVLLENRGINFANVVRSARSVSRENEDGVQDVDWDRLSNRLNVIATNFRCAYSSRAFTAFLMFELVLVVAPIALIVLILPLMIGDQYCTWGLDVARAWWENREWQDSPLPAFFDLFVSGGQQSARVAPPLIPRYTFCDFSFDTFANPQTLTYRCYLDANWHERTALFTWYMLFLIFCINLSNLFFWLKWAVRMRARANRRKWVVRRWLNTEGFSDDECAIMMRFAEEFNMSQLLLFCYIEAHADCVVASAFCTALFARRLERRRQRLTTLGSISSGGTTPQFSWDVRHSSAKGHRTSACSSLTHSPIL